MEELKKFDDLTMPDERQKAFAIINRASGQYRSRTLQDIYQSASDIKLHSGVPEAVRTHFATAQNLLVYSWFFYPFNVTAEFLAYVTIEFALKERLCIQHLPSRHAARVSTANVMCRHLYFATRA